MKLYQLRLEGRLSRKELEEWLPTDDDVTSDPNSVKPFSNVSDAARFLSDVRRCLVLNGVQIDINEQSPGGAAAIAEAVNWAAKTIDLNFYSLKPYAVVSAALLGASLWNRGGVWYLYGKGIGTVSFHDPHDEINYLVSHYDIPVKDWGYEWSGISRQEDAFDILKNKKLRKRYDDLTRPRHLMKHPDIEKQENASYKEYLKHKRNKPVTAAPSNI